MTDDLPTLGELFRRADEIGGPMPDKIRQALEVVASGLLEMLVELEAVDEPIPTLDDLPPLTPEQEAEAIEWAEQYARDLASDVPVAPPPRKTYMQKFRHKTVSKGQEMHALVETAPWGPRPAAPTHRGYSIG